MTSPVLSTIPIGLAHTPSPVAERRTPSQRAAVAAIVNDPEFDFACHNPLTEEVGRSYRGPFNLLYCTRDGRLHLIRIGGRGQVLRHFTPNDGTYDDDTD